MIRARAQLARAEGDRRGDIEAAMKIVEGTARSMGVDVAR